MKKVETIISDDMFAALSKITPNKAEFIRQAIQDKIESKESKSLPKILSKLDDNENRLHQAEKMIFLLNQTMEKLTKLSLKLYELNASTKLFVIENIGVEVAKTKIDAIKGQVENQLQLITEQLEI